MPDEILHGHMGGESGHIPQIGDPLPDAGDPLGADFLGGNAKRFRQAGQICPEQQGTVMEQPLRSVGQAVDALGVAGYLRAIHHDIVPAVGFRLHAQIGESTEDGINEGAEIDAAGGIVGSDVGEIHIAQIVEHGSAAGHAPDHGDPVGFRIGNVDLGPGVLILADDHGVIVPPEHKDILRPVGEKIFFRRQIEGGIGTVVNDNAHNSLE